MRWWWIVELACTCILGCWGGYAVYMVVYGVKRNYQRNMKRITEDGLRTMERVNEESRRRAVVLGRASREPKIAARVQAAMEAGGFDALLPLYDEIVEQEQPQHLN